MRDPVCGVEVDEKKAPATSSYEGGQYVFCGQRCKDEFDQNPQQYAESEIEEPQHTA